LLVELPLNEKLECANEIVFEFIIAFLQEKYKLAGADNMSTPCYLL